MKFKKTIVGMQKNILANDHYVAIPYNCSSLTAGQQWNCKSRNNHS